MRLNINMKINSFDILAPFYDLAMGIFRRSIPARIFRCLKPEEKDVILDLGGGTGYNSGRMVRDRQFLIVFDISLEMLKRARKYKNVTLVQGDAKNLPFRDKSFDIIMAVDSLHHIQDYSGVLSEVRRTGRNKFFTAEFYGLTLIGKIFTGLERFLMSVSYKSPDDFLQEALHHGITGELLYISSYEYFFTGSIH